MQALKRPFIGFPIYAWLIGGALFGVALIFFLRSRGGGTAGGVGGTGGTGTAGAPGATGPGGAVQPFPTGPPPPANTGTKPLPVWQFGNFPSTGQYVWRATEQGVTTAQSKGITFPRDVMPSPLTQDILQLTGPWGTQWAIVPNGYSSNQYAQAINNGTLLNLEDGGASILPFSSGPGGVRLTNAGQPIYTQSQQFGSAIAVA